MKANRRTATGILRAYFEKNNIADGEDFEILDYRKFLADEKEAYRRQCGIDDVFNDYGKFTKYVKKQVFEEEVRMKKSKKKSPRSVKTQGLKYINICS